ncbi:hypothetical protein AEM51_04875 [Bacteroidetes bacterium UKL13-3]|jgi:hypothetical protein|nr:hypothetical protein AEM51_04875 [Bacteroidetes bacterium UKL13-3]
MWEDDENFSDEDYNKEQERVENLPIVKKANELFELVNALIETFDIKDKEGEENIPFADEVDEQNTDFDEEDEDDFEEEDAEELDEEDLKSFGEHYKGIMMEDVMIINAKLRGAEGGDLYSIRMENAVIIKVHAMSLLTATSGLKMMGLSNNKYLQLLRDEIEEFRKLFVEWVNTFDKTNDIPDGWGLFFDPNIDYKNFEDEE